MSFLFESFQGWKQHCQEANCTLYQPVIQYEKEQKGMDEEEIWSELARVYQVMKEAVHTGLNEDMTSRSRMINNGAKKVAQNETAVLSKEFQTLVSSALAAKEVNSCMGRVVAAPTAGASGILPGVLTTLQSIHRLDDRRIHEALLVSAGIALILEQKASLAGAVGGCQAEKRAAPPPWPAGAIVYSLGGAIDQLFHAVGITLQCMLGLVCDPVAGLVEVPCVVRNASAAAIANSSAQIALSDVDAVIPVDECAEAMGEVGAKHGNAIQRNRSRRASRHPPQGSPSPSVS